MLFELDVSFIILSNGSVTRHPLPSAGSLGQLSLLHRYNGVLRLPNVLPASRRLSLRYAVPPLFATEASGYPRFLGDLRAHALLTDPGESVAPNL